jgi:hypothetical protein
MKNGKRNVMINYLLKMDNHISDMKLNYFLIFNYAEDF